MPKRKERERERNARRKCQRKRNKERGKECDKRMSIKEVRRKIRGTPKECIKQGRRKRENKE